MTTAPRPDEEQSRQPAGSSDEGHVEEGGREEAPMDGLLPDSGKNPSKEGESESAAVVDADFDALLADVKRERDEYLELAQRARADFDNFRKRSARETRDGERRGKAAVARELLPALDNLERALRSAGIDPDARPDPDGGGEPVSEEVTAQQALARGVDLVLGELRAALERAGVETYDPVGQRFDPAEHEALAVRPAEDGEEGGIVIETLEKGYRLDGQVLRAARVVVSE
jgi:molecular chaperone GrpE